MVLDTLAYNDWCISERSSRIWNIVLLNLLPTFAGNSEQGSNHYEGALRGTVSSDTLDADFIGMEDVNDLLETHKLQFEICARSVPPS